MSIELSDGDLNKIAGRVSMLLTGAEIRFAEDIAGCSRCDDAGDDSDEILTVDELAELLKVKTSWVYNGVFKKKLPYFKAGKHLRFIKSKVLKCLCDQSSDLPLSRG